MRWFVEVAEGSHTAAERWVVEAAHWQPALKAARSLRGEQGETTGFSVELLEDGFRAIDPSTLVRYVLRVAPEETPLSRPVEPKPPEKNQPERGPKKTNGQAAANNHVKHAPAPADTRVREEPVASRTAAPPAETPAPERRPSAASDVLRAASSAAATKPTSSK